MHSRIGEQFYTLQISTTEKCMSRNIPWIFSSIQSLDSLLNPHAVSSTPYLTAFPWASSYIGWRSRKIQLGMCMFQVHETWFDLWWNFSWLFCSQNISHYESHKCYIFKCYVNACLKIVPFFGWEHIREITILDCDCLINMMTRDLCYQYNIVSTATKILQVLSIPYIRNVKSVLVFELWQWEQPKI